MNGTARNTVIVVIVIIVVVALVFAFKGPSTPTDNSGQTATTSTSVTSSGGGNTSSGSQEGTAGTGSNGGTVAGINIESDQVILEVANSELVRIPQTGVDVALTNGRGTYKEGSSEGSVALGNVIGKVKTENGYDVFVQMAFTKKGSQAVQQYVALFTASRAAVSFKSAVLVGDRVNTLGVAGTEDMNAPGPHPTNGTVMNSTAGYVATINYLDRKNGEPVTTTPTLAKTLAVHVKAGIMTR